MRFLVSVALNAVALWLVTLLLSGINVQPFGDGDTWSLVLTYLVLALIWGVVNAVIGSIVRVVSLPLYIVTLGLFAIVVNGFLFWLVSVFTDSLTWGLTVENFWWAIGGGVLMGIFSAILNGLFNRVRRSDERRSR